MPIGATEITISNGGHGGDFVLDATGDLQLSIDSTSSQPATQERLLRLVKTCPTLFDALGNPVAPPDDLFNATYGAGAPDLVDEDLNTVQPTLRARILHQVALDPTIATSPAPSVTFTTDAVGGNLNLTLSVFDVDGQPITIGPVPVSSIGS